MNLNILKTAIIVLTFLLTFVSYANSNEKDNKKVKVLNDNITFIKGTDNYYDNNNLKTCILSKKMIIQG